jgi:hypothetical protein
MAPTQSCHVPPPGSRPRLSDTGWLTAFGLRGLARLIRARLAFARFDVRDIVDRNARAGDVAGGSATATDPALVARIAYVIPRISARLPWRSDCVIQAMAAQDWLADHGLASEIRIGVEGTTTGKFGAHAWLVHRGEIVTGGDIERYDVLLGSAEQ